MICAKPYIRAGPHGVSKLKALTNEDARLAATPFGCGQCLPCRINKARIWQHRILLESYMTPMEDQMFFTCTYADEHLPEGNKLVKSDYINWLKLVRKEFPDDKIRYFGIGEYGSEGTRKINPHFHTCFFGIGPKTTERVGLLWGKGRIDVGEINRKSAAYIVGYVCKGLTRDKDIQWYSENRDKEYMGLTPEFVSRSTGKPGGLGVDACYMVARQLQASGFYKGQYIKNLQHGKESWPLGRYLQDKINGYLNADTQEREINFWAYQCSNIIKHMKGDSIYVENIVEEDDGAREKKLWWEKNLRRKREIRAKNKRDFAMRLSKVSEGQSP